MNIFIYFTDWAKAIAIGIGVIVTTMAEPFVDFNREADIKQSISLQEKADLFDRDIIDNHLSDGGVFWYEHPINPGDMCAWNGVHVAYRAIRYGHTKSEGDLLKLKTYVLSLGRMQTHPLTGKTILLRGVVKESDFGADNPNWGQTPGMNSGNGWVWREDASGDSFGGHMFGMAMAYKYGDQSIRNYVADLAKALYYKLESDKFKLTNSDGTITRFHQIGPSVMSSPMSIANLLVLTKILELHFNDDSKKLYRKFAIRKNQIHVASHNSPMVLTKKKYAGMNLAKMGLHSLHELEANPKYKKKYKKGFRRMWRNLKEDGDALLTVMVYNAYPKVVKQRHLGLVSQVLHEFSTLHKTAGHIDLTLDDSIRKVTWGGLKASEPFPVWKQPAKDYYWQRDPHELSDHKGRQYGYKKFTGLDFLTAFYMAKLHGVID